MLVVYSPDHGVHRGQEIHNGKVIAAFESPRRAEAILGRIQSTGLGPVAGPRDFGDGPLHGVHGREYVSFLRSAWRRQGNRKCQRQLMPNLPWPVGAPDKCPNSLQGQLNFFAADVCVSIGRGTWEAARTASQVALTAAACLKDGARSAFALCRPPGHHAAARMAGYCFLNNAAIAAQHLADNGARVAILDIDYHHGNGTQSVFYSRADVLFVSVHADPASAYPYCAGYADEVGAGPGEGYNLNLPLVAGAAWRTYAQALGVAMSRIFVFGPDILVVSLGVDTYERDPIGRFRLKLPDYLVLGQSLAAPDLPTLFVMEGGYTADDEALGTAVVNVLEGFEGRR